MLHINSLKNEMKERVITTLSKEIKSNDKPHGNILRSNIKENKCDSSPNGPKVGGPEVRAPRLDEIPNIK